MSHFVSSILLISQKKKEPDLMTSRQASEKLQLLGEFGWLAEEPEDFRKRVAAAGSWQSLQDQQSAYHAGDASSSLYGLGAGFLDVLFPVDGEEEVLVHRAPPGLWIGNGTLFTGVSRVISVRAAGECQLFVVPGGVLREVLAKTPEYWASLQRLSARNSILAVTILAELLAWPPQRRFASLLLRSADSSGIVRATQEELGRLVGLNRMAFRRACRGLVESGVVRSSYGSTEIIDRGRLELLVTSGASHLQGI
jgi:CRP-like cAMP-binding protein